MAASRMVQARVPGEIQDAANQVIQASGLTVSDVVRVLMTRIAQDKAIPSALFQPNAKTLEAFAEIDQFWHSRLVHLDLAVDMVPRMRLRPGETWPEEVVADGDVPLARLVPAGVDRSGQPTRARLVLFRQPLTRRAPDGDDLRDLVYSVFVELVSQHLEISPEEVESGPDEH